MSQRFGIKKAKIEARRWSGEILSRNVDRGLHNGHGAAGIRYERLGIFRSKAKTRHINWNKRGSPRGRRVEISWRIARGRNSNLNNINQIIGKIQSSKSNKNRDGVDIQ